jgi:hypothetical protein
VLPGFTAEKSLKSNFDYYSICAGGRILMKNQVLPSKSSPRLPDGDVCTPKCGPCINGEQTCITRDCDEVDRSCGITCQPHCGPCINSSMVCTRRDCTTVTESCHVCPCNVETWCSGVDRFYRNCDCSITREVNGCL